MIKPTQQSILPTAIILACFFTSGACGLIYEGVWVRLLSLVFGVTVYAVSTVLCVFMGGLALGAIFIGRVIDRRRDALRVYALLEIGISLYTLLTPWMIDSINPIYVSLYRAVGGAGLGLTIARVALAALVLIVPTIMMGATLPVLTRHFTRVVHTVGRKVAYLYAINTFGAVVGIIIGGFILMPELGIRGAIITAVSVNLSAGLLALVVYYSQGEMALSTPSGKYEKKSISDQNKKNGKKKQTRETTTKLSRAQRYAAIAFGISGFTALAYEVLWSRILTFYLNNSVYAFSTMLAVFLFGIAAGSAMVAPLVGSRRRIRNPIPWLGGIQVLITLTVIFSVWIYPHLPNIFNFLMAGRPMTSWLQAISLMFVQAAVVMLPTTLLFGAVFPIAAHTFAVKGRRPGRSIGILYGWNTVGSIFGSLAAGFGLITVFGLRGSFLLLMGINLLLGLFLLSDALKRLRPAAIMISILGTGLFIHSCIALPAGIMLPAMQQRLGDSIIFYREGLIDTVAVNEFPMFGKTHRMLFFGDGRGTSGTFTVEENRLSAYLPLFLCNHDVHDALIICFGTGNTLAAPTLWDTTGRVACAEISRDVWDAAEYFRATNMDVNTNPKVEQHVEDGRTFVLAAPDNSLDMIGLEPPFLHTATVVNLYTNEFYSECRRALRPGGVMSQWFSFVEYSPEEMKMLFKTFQNNFPYTYVFDQGYWACAVLVGSDEPLNIDLARMEERLDRQPRIQKDLVDSGLQNLPRLLSYFWKGPQDLRKWCGDVPLITDNRTVVDFTSPRGLGSGYGFDKSQGNLFINVTDPVTGEDLWEKTWRDRYDLMINERRSIDPYVKNYGSFTREEFLSEITHYQNMRKFKWKLVPDEE